MTPADPGWELQTAGFSSEGLLHDTGFQDDRPAGGDRDEHRRHLRLVREQARRRTNGRRLLVSAGIALLGVFCLGLVTLHVLIAENQFTLDRLQQTAASKQASYEKLRLQLAQLEAPARIVSEAEGRLGLVQPGSVTYLPAISSQATNGGGTGGPASTGAASAGDASAGKGSTGSGSAGAASPGSLAAPQGDADWPSIKPYLSGSP